MDFRGRDTVTEKTDGGVAELVPDPICETGWALLVDDWGQSFVDTAGPCSLNWDYVRRLDAVIDCMAQPGAPIHALHRPVGQRPVAEPIRPARVRANAACTPYEYRRECGCYYNVTQGFYTTHLRYCYVSSSCHTTCDDICGNYRRGC